jgi:hypothetical protein
MRIIYLSLVFFLLFAPAFSQKFITGKVTDVVTGKSVEGAIIQVRNTNKQTSSPADGTYMLSLP